MAPCPRDKDRDGCSIHGGVSLGGKRAPWLPPGTPVPMNSPLSSPGTGQEPLFPGTAGSPRAHGGERGALGFFPHQPTSCYAPKKEPLGCSLSPAALCQVPSGAGSLLAAPEPLQPQSLVNRDGNLGTIPAPGWALSLVLRAQ